MGTLSRLFIGFVAYQLAGAAAIGFFILGTLVVLIQFGFNLAAIFFVFVMSTIMFAVGTAAIYKGFTDLGELTD